MQYQIEVLEQGGFRKAVYDDVLLLEAERGQVDRGVRVEGLLPPGLAELGPGDRIRVLVDGALFCEAPVRRVTPQWGDLKTLILDKYVNAHELVYVEASTSGPEWNNRVQVALLACPVKTAVQQVIDRALGAVHYGVAHTAFPDGAQREYAKFEARKTAGNELETGGISAGQWVGAPRLDASEAYAKDGDTIAGLKVDGAAWPDLRLLMIDAEETSKNGHAVSRHPEVTAMTAEEYAASAYAWRAQRSKESLQALIDGHGIDAVELNPHRNAAGAFDDRVDAYGRYVGLIYGGGLCFNAAMVEQGMAEIYLYEEGRYHEPSMALKDYYSYVGPSEDTLAVVGGGPVSMAVDAGLMEALMALALMGGGCRWGVRADGTVWFCEASTAEHVAFESPSETGVSWGMSDIGLVNELTFEGGELALPLTKTYAREASVRRYGSASGRLVHYGLNAEQDVDRLAAALLDDLAYPSLTGDVVFHRGKGDVHPGELIEIRGAPFRRYHEALSGEWGGRYAGRLVGAVASVTHRFTGRRVRTTATLTSPGRAVENPLRFIVRSQPSEAEMYAFRLDDEVVGLDMSYHLD